MKKSTIVAAAFLAGALLAAEGVLAQAVQVCAPLDEHGKGHISDALFKGKMSTSSADLTGFCMTLVGPGLGQTGPTVFSMHTVPSDVSGACQASGPDATSLDVTCDDGVVTKLKGSVN